MPIASQLQYTNEYKSMQVPTDREFKQLPNGSRVISPAGGIVPVDGGGFASSREIPIEGLSSLG